MSKLLFLLGAALLYTLLCMACTCRHRGALEALLDPVGRQTPPRMSAGGGGFGAGTPGKILVTREGGRVRLSGMVASREAREALVKEATARYGSDGFINSLQMPANPGRVDPEWLKNALKAVTWGGLGDLIMNERAVTLRGVQPSEEARIQRFEYVKKTLGETWKVTDEMTVESTAATPAPARPTPAATPSSQNATTPQNLKAFKGVEFETSSATITPAGQALLDEAAAVMATTGAIRYEVGGHTDDRGSAAANQNLSERRADAVKKYLMDKGIDRERLETHGYGESRPIAPNDSVASRARNRRIEFTELK